MFRDRIKLISEAIKKLKYNLLKENNGDKFKPTVAWMSEWYDKMNKELFGGLLGPCKFTTSTGSKTYRVLGSFRLTGNNLAYVKQGDRQIFYRPSYALKPVFINKNNFAELCKPEISLNGNYSATYDGWLNTLVHEMCHYYTYMYGYVPKQAHGVEFREIAAIVANRSNGTITIQRIASAEKMENFELESQMQQQLDARKNRLQSKLMALLTILDDGSVRLTTTTSDSLFIEIGDANLKKQNNLLFYGRSQDPKLISFLIANGYKHNMRTYRFWQISSQPWVKDLPKYVWMNYLGKCDTVAEALGIENQQPQKTVSNDGYHEGYKIISDGNGYNLTDGKNKTFKEPVDSLWFDDTDMVFRFTKGRFEYEGFPGKWIKNN